MLLFFSPHISTRRKVFYYGAMILVASVVLFSMNIDGDLKISKMIMAGTIGGLSLIILSMVYSNTRQAYSKISSGLVYFFISLIPILLMVISHLIFVFLSYESFGEEILLKNMYIVLFGVPVVLMGAWFLNRDIGGTPSK